MYSASPSRGRRRATPTRSVLAAILYTLVVLLALCLPGDSIEGEDGWLFTPPPGSDKVGHAGLFFLETRFLRRAFLALRLSSPLAFAVAGALALAVLTEAAQMAIPGRDGDGYDLLADALGAGFYAWLFHWRFGREESPNIAEA